MVYKLFIEDGEYIDRTSKEPRNLLCANWADTPEGLNFGWIESDTLAQAMEYFNVEARIYESIN